MLLIEVSGIDGSGKTTAVNYLYNKLKKEGKRVVTIKEVGNQHIPEMVELRKIILNPNSQISYLALESIFLGMALQNIQWINENKDNYDYIICDRGFACKYAYGKAMIESKPNKEKVCFEKLLDVHQMLRVPPIALYFKIDPSVSQQRIKQRNGGSDKIEDMGFEYQKRVAFYYDEYFDANANHSYTIDASQPIENIEKFLDVVLVHIEKRYLT